MGVCGSEWDRSDAHTVCRSMGFGDAIEATVGAIFGSSPGNLTFNNVQCNGSEQNIFECPYSITTSCDHFQTAGVKCSGERF